MKIIIFAGGAGTRLWPLSRLKSPKQFEKIVNSKSSLQLTVDRLIPEFKYEDIFISTNIIYKKLIHKQLPLIPKKNFIFEPAKKDTGPAVLLSLLIIKKNFPNEPVIILWSDHIIRKEKKFKKIIKIAVEKIKRDSKKIIFISQKPRYPNSNLGYIHFGDKIKEIDNINFYSFLGFRYKPGNKLAKRYFQIGSYAWNLGYFVAMPDYIINLYKKFNHQLYKHLRTVVNFYNKKNFDSILSRIYISLPSSSFDNEILEKIDKKSALVIKEDIDWSDIGSWEQLKEALQKNKKDNVTKGNIYTKETTDSLIYNFEKEKLVVGIDLKEAIIVNTKDVILICKKSSMEKLKKIVEEFKNKENFI